MDAINLPVTAIITLMIGCTILAVAYVDQTPMMTNHASHRVEEGAMTTVGERMIARAVSGAKGPDVERLVKEARATYGAEGLPLLREGAARLMARSENERTRDLAYSVRRELDLIADETMVNTNAKSAAPLGGAEPNTNELTTY